MRVTRRTVVRKKIAQPTDDQDTSDDTFEQVEIQELPEDLKAKSISSQEEETKEKAMERKMIQRSKGTEEYLEVGAQSSAFLNIYIVHSNSFARVYVSSLLIF